MIDEGLLGMTSNPTIFERAIGSSSDYDEAMRPLIAAGATAEQIFDALTIEDVGLAADIFRPVFDRTRGKDGYVSIEVSPKLAHDTASTLADARRLWQILKRPNVLIKIPATQECLPAIEQALTEGINVNVTLMFSLHHYLAVAEAYLRALEARVKAGQPIDHVGSVASFIIEKPFGIDLDSARQPNKEVLGVFEESQVYRIDHYLGKETVQNLLVFRFANGIFEPIWNRNYVDHIQITAAETVGVEGRGGYSEGAGAMRDLIQNHMLQLLALTAMEPPVLFDAQQVRDEKQKVYQAVRQIRPAEVHKYSVRGQYAEGNVGGKAATDYRSEPGVSPASVTETYVFPEVGESDASGIGFILGSLHPLQVPQLEPDHGKQHREHE